jgi:hypothetical protein
MTAARGAWYRRLGLEARNVTVTTLAGLVAVALFVGAVIVVTALAVR